MISKYKPVYSQSLPPPHGSKSFDTNEHVGCWRMRCRAHRRIPISEAFATSEKWGFFGSVDICSKGFACRESCYVNRQVLYFEINF